jgi:hypothetical protein
MLLVTIISDIIIIIIIGGKGSRASPDRSPDDIHMGAHMITKSVQREQIKLTPRHPPTITAIPVTIVIVIILLLPLLLLLPPQPPTSASASRCSMTSTQFRSSTLWPTSSARTKNGPAVSSSFVPSTFPQI